MLDTVVFDLDGTLLDTLGDLRASVNHALAKRGHPLRTPNEIRAFLGNGAKRLITLSAPEGTDEREIERLLALFNDHYALHALDSTAPYDGILPLLSDLKREGFRVAVVSNKPDYGVRSLCDRFFKNEISFCLGQREELKRKPAPDMLFAALRALDSAPERALYVGDSEVDLQTAKNAGMRCLAVNWGFRSEKQLLEAGATTTFSTPKQLYEEILRLRSERKI